MLETELFINPRFRHGTHQCRWSRTNRKEVDAIRISSCGYTGVVQQLDIVEIHGSSIRFYHHSTIGYIYISIWSLRAVSSCRNNVDPFEPIVFLYCSIGMVGFCYTIIDNFLKSCFNDTFRICNDDAFRRATSSSCVGGKSSCSSRNSIRYC